MRCTKKNFTPTHRIHPHMTRKKGRAFDGCWTCRQRKVKCDLTKPKCIRCFKSNRICQGYEIRLGWSLPMTYCKLDNSLTYLKIDGYEENLDNFQRRNVDFVKYPERMTYETYDQLNEVLGKFDDCKLETCIGPFRCIRMFEAKESEDDATVPSTNKRRNGSSAPEHVNKRLSPTKERLETAEMSIDSEGLEESESIDEYTVDKHLIGLLNFAKLTIIGIKGPKYEINHQTIYHIFNPEFFPNVDSDDDWVVDARLNLSKLWVKENTSSIRLTLLFQKLLQNFKSEYISFNRMGYKNSYIDLFIIPFIRQIFGEFICWDFINWDFEFENLDLDDVSSAEGILKNIKLVIIYLTLSISAFHLSKPIGLGPEFRLDEHLTMSLYFRKLGIFLLNHHLDETDTIIELLKDNEPALESYNCCILLSLVLQIEMDNNIQIFEDFELIYAIGDFIINNIHSSKHKISNLLKLLVNMVKIMAIFYKSTQAINMFNYQIDRNYDEEDENAERIQLSDSEDDDDEDEDEDDDEEDNGYMKPAIKNLIISSEPMSETMSYTVSFNNNGSSKSRHNSRSLPPGQPQPTQTTTIKEKELFLPNDNFTYNLDMNHIYQMYGIPKSLLDLFNEIIHLTNHKNIYTTRQSFPRNFPKICTDFEDRLINWTIVEDSHWNLVPGDPGHDVLRLNITGFHKALIAYYNQLLKKFAKLKDYQDLIDSSLADYLELLRLGPDTQRHVRPLVWNLLILGSCTLDTQVMHRIRELLCGSPEVNQWRCKQILFEIWNKREKDGLDDVDESLGFMSMIREYGIVLNLG